MVAAMDAVGNRASPWNAWKCGSVASYVRAHWQRSYLPRVHDRGDTTVRPVQDFGNFFPVMDSHALGSVAPSVTRIRTLARLSRCMRLRRFVASGERARPSNPARLAAPVSPATIFCSARWLIASRTASSGIEIAILSPACTTGQATGDG